MTLSDVEAKHRGAYREVCGERVGARASAKREADFERGRAGARSSRILKDTFC
jgi:hypothetical protein